MRIIFISPNRILHTQWNKAVSADVNIYDENELKDFSFSERDIIIFDLDNFEDNLGHCITFKVIGLSSNLDEIKGFRLLKKGLKAYGNTYMTPMNLKNAITTVSNNELWLYPELISFIIKHSTLKNIKVESTKFDELSPRELEVSKLVSQGLTNKEIADKLKIAERTVKAHMGSIFNKINIKDRVTLGLMVKEILN
jgi:DNA-binding NarL/FixJ family response regulator